MIFRKCTINDLEAALAKVNKKYDNNIIFNRLDAKGFTLRVKDCKKAGHRRGFPEFTGFNSPPNWNKRRRLSSACWHVHGDFFDALFKIEPEAEITTSGSLANPLPINKITKDKGNWQDWDIGAKLNPYMMSEACDCD